MKSYRSIEQLYRQIRSYRSCPIIHIDDLALLKKDENIENAYITEWKGWLIRFYVEKKFVNKKFSNRHYMVSLKEFYQVDKKYLISCFYRSANRVVNGKTIIKTVLESKIYTTQFDKSHCYRENRPEMVTYRYGNNFSEREYSYMSIFKYRDGVKYKTNKRKITLQENKKISLYQYSSFEEYVTNPYIVTEEGLKEDQKTNKMWLIKNKEFSEEEYHGFLNGLGIKYEEIDEKAICLIDMATIN